MYDWVPWYQFHQWPPGVIALIKHSRSVRGKSSAFAWRMWTGVHLSLSVSLENGTELQGLRTHPNCPQHTRNYPKMRTGWTKTLWWRHQVGMYTCMTACVRYNVATPWCLKSSATRMCFNCLFTLTTKKISKIHRSLMPKCYIPLLRNYRKYKYIYIYIYICTNADSPPMQFCAQDIDQSVKWV